MDWRRYSPYFGIIVGSIMIIYWIISFIVPDPLLMRDLEERPWDMGMHIVAELATAAILVVGGMMMRSSAIGPKGRTVFVLGLGMLTYTMIATIGWSVHEGIYPMVIFMIILLTITAIILTSMLNPYNNK